MPHHVVCGLTRRLYSPARRSVMLRRDLDRPLATPTAKVPIDVRPAADRDVRQIRALLSELSGYDRSTRERFLDLQIGTCYVAVNGDAEICYMQWLVGPEHNQLLDSYTNLPILKDREALLENAVTPRAFRGLRIMSAAMAQIAERGAQLGARWVITVVSEDNVPSIKGCRNAGFEPCMLKLDGWRLLRHQIRYTDLPDGYAAPGGEPSPVMTPPSTGTAPHDFA
jgi:hypothetical protein